VWQKSENMHNADKKIADEIDAVKKQMGQWEALLPTRRRRA
jgi:hypothetical protein